jgi:Leucine-rich repeat (LRR) protein
MAVIIGLVILLGLGLTVSRQFSINQTNNRIGAIDTNTTEIDLSNKNLDYFPTKVLTNKNIKILDLSHNNIQSIPAQISKLINLEDLTIDNNSLTGSLPAQINRLSELNTLRASHNNLTAIPAEVGQLKKLTILDLSNNNIDTIPNEIFNLKNNLKILNISGNRLSDTQIQQITNELPGTRVIR